ncbi:hypothetical protein MKZ38_000362 [Zalerion maritima]|uniref:FAD-binding domain-containing protein n=1 Tax=Zalerion maritima TaxID=339359 RepID=A0AAD5RSF6_9PEZI|nr:hypothetical protein MKZ38_000362 [Zalerion maritima]
MAGPRELEVAIIGSGMGGLACALALAKKGFKKIDVYETASSLGFVGAGLQMAPNMARILDKWQCWEQIEAEATVVRESSIRQGSNNEELAHVHMPNIKNLYGHNHVAGHRFSLANGMYQACLKEPTIKFHFAHMIESVSAWSPKVTFTLKPRNGDAFTRKADVLLGADGIKSTTRTHLLSSLDLPSQPTIQDTDQAAYRIMLKREQVKDDPEILALLDGDCVTRWIGPQRHIIAYSVDNHDIYNLSTTQPDTHFAAAPNASYTTLADKGEMIRVFQDFCPLVHRMLDYVPEGEVCEWRLRVHAPLPTWTRGSCALVGDACHPTLPHLSQGAAMAIEDGAVIGEVLAKSDGTPESIAKCLKVFELLRRERTQMMVDLAKASGRALHLGEGKAKEERDRLFREAKEKGIGQQTVPDKWASPEVQKMIYSYDCVQESNDYFDKLSKEAAKVVQI